MSNGYEIRHGLLSEARDTLMQSWHQKWEVETRTAEREDRAPQPVPLPTTGEILKLATEWYDFVQTKEPAKAGPQYTYTVSCNCQK